MNVDDYSLSFCIFSNVTVATKIVLRLLCCHEPYRRPSSCKGSLFSSIDLHIENTFITVK